MCWSLVILCLKEAAQDKINDVVAAASKSSDGDVLSRICEDPSDKESDSKDSSSNELNGKKHEAFKKVLAANESWLDDVLDDALSYAATATPRDKKFTQRILSGTHSPKKTGGESQVQSTLTIKFEEDVWPTLRSRGWKVNEKRGSNNKSYAYNSESFSSIASVLNAIPKKHPELMNMVNSLISSVRALCKEEEDTTTASAPLVVDRKNLTASSLNELLMLFAPLQLLADRTRVNRITLHHNSMVSRMSMVKALHAKVKLADKNLPASATEADRTTALAKLIKVDSKITLPHPQWTSLHDAVLLRAAAKHGWVDRKLPLTEINNDKAIQWGRPFESEAAECDKSNEAEKKPEVDIASDTKYNMVLAVATRATSFLNSFKDELSEGLTAASYNELQEKLVKTYCLTLQDEDGGGFKVDEDHLKKLVLVEEASNEDCEELPSRNALSKRLRKVVSSFINKSNDAQYEEEEVPKDGVNAGAAVKENYGYALIDQTVRSNILLAEMTRGLLKLTKKSNKQKHFADRILSEICGRIDDMTNSGERGDSLAVMKKVKEHIIVYSDNFKSSIRPAKNVLRVILGIDPVESKSGTNEGLFPMTEEEKSISKLAKAALNKRKKNSETPADRTLLRALETIARDEDGTSSDILRITTTELLILTVITSQGLPVHCDDWSKSVSIENLLDDENLGDDFKLYFSCTVGVVKACSEVWVETAKHKLEDKIRLLKTMEANNPSKSNIVEEISILQKDYDFKKTTRREALQFCNDPLSFAKKLITLVEALRKNMGPVDLNYAGEKKTRMLNKSENGLGTKCLNWLAKELSRWGHVSFRSLPMRSNSLISTPYQLSPLSLALS